MKVTVGGQELKSQKDVTSKPKKAQRRAAAANSGDILDVWSRPGYLVRRLHQLSVAIFHDEMNQLSLTPVQLGALMVVARTPGIEQSALSEALGIDPVNTADVVRRLVKNELLHREPAEFDRRYKLITLTAGGQQLLRRSRKHMARVQERFLAPLDVRQRVAFMQLVRRLIEGLNDQGRTSLNIESPHKTDAERKRRRQI